MQFSIIRSPEERWQEALDPKHVAISLSGEPTLYRQLPAAHRSLQREGLYNISREQRYKSRYACPLPPVPDVCLARCTGSGDLYCCMSPAGGLLGTGKREPCPAGNTTFRSADHPCQGFNDFAPEKYAAILQDSGASFVEVKGYMYLGYSRNRLVRENMPEHERVRSFAEKIAAACDYRIKDENILSRVVCLERKT